MMPKVSAHHFGAPIPREDDVVVESVLKNILNLVS